MPEVGEAGPGEHDLGDRVERERRVAGNAAAKLRGRGLDLLGHYLAVERRDARRLAEHFGVTGGDALADLGQARRRTAYQRTPSERGLGLNGRS